MGREGWRRWRVAYTATDLSESFPQGDSVMGSSHGAVRGRVCLCVRVCVHAHLKSNDEHHPDRDLGKTELSVNWNCHIHSKCLSWRLPPVSRHRDDLALSSLFWRPRGGSQPKRAFQLQNLPRSSSAVMPVCIQGAGKKKNRISITWGGVLML